jgi:ubiquinone/menaquinone biosynthesis C-methylase UbiE
VSADTFQGPLPQPLTELDRYAVNLYDKTLRGTGGHTARVDGATSLRVLEVGSGRGGGLFALHRKYPQHRFHGLDLSAPAVADASRRFDGPMLEFRTGDALALPLADCSIDAVINIESSHNYPDLPRFFHEVQRVLAPGGYFGYTDIMGSAAAEQRAAMLRQTAGLTVTRTENITGLVLAALDSAEHNDNKLRMVDEHYANVPAGLRLLLPKRLFRNLAAVQGSPQHQHFQDGSESYMFYELTAAGVHCKPAAADEPQPVAEGRVFHSDHTTQM